DVLAVGVRMLGDVRVGRDHRLWHVVPPAHGVAGSTYHGAAVGARLHVRLMAGASDTTPVCGRMRRVKTLCSAALVTLALAIPRGAPAHPLAPALLDVRQRADGQLDVGWKTPLVRPRGTVLAPALPARCHAVGPQTESQDGGGMWTRWVAACGPGG